MSEVNLKKLRSWHLMNLIGSIIGICVYMQYYNIWICKADIHVYFAS